MKKNGAFKEWICPVCKNKYVIPIDYCPEICDDCRMVSLVLPLNQ